MDWKTVASDPCPVSSSLELFGDRWSMLVIRDVMNGVRRFDDLVERLSISRATLADRLRRLTASGILAPSEYEDSRRARGVPADGKGVGAAVRVGGAARVA